MDVDQAKIRKSWKKRADSHLRAWPGKTFVRHTVEARALVLYETDAEKAVRHQQACI